MVMTGEVIPFEVFEVQRKRHVLMRRVLIVRSRIDTVVARRDAGEMHPRVASEELELLVGELELLREQVA
jgi:hypothetical protein